MYKSKIIKWIINNILMVGIGIVFVAILLLPDNHLSIDIVSYPDSYLDFSTNNGVLEQTWTPNIKNIECIRVPFEAMDDFSAIMCLGVYTDKMELLKESTIHYTFKAQESGELEFPLSRIDVQPGCQYRIQLRYLAGTEVGTISIKAAKDYCGAYIDEVEQNHALALRIGFIKASRIKWMVITILPFFLVSFFLAVLFDKRIEETAGLATIGLVLFLFLFGLFGYLEVGVKTVFPICVLFFVLSFVLVRKKRINTNALLTPGTFMWMGGIGYIVVACHGLYFKYWDEYTHWGLAVKDMFYSNAFSGRLGSTVFEQRYPPFSTLTEYFFCYTYDMYSEEITYVAYAFLISGLCLVIFKNSSWKRVWNNVPAVVIVSLILPFVFKSLSCSLYVDPLLGVLFGYVLICYYSEKMNTFNILRIASGLMALVLTKETGLVLAGLAFMLITTDRVWKAVKQREKVLSAKTIQAMIILLVSFLGAFIIWQIYLSVSADTIQEETALVNEIEIPQIEERNNKGNTSLAASNISVSGIVDLFTMKAPAYRYQVIKNFWSIALFGDVYEIGGLGFSYFEIGFFILICSILLSRFCNKNKQGLLSIGVLGFLILLGYACFLLITYLFTFGEGEAVQITSNDRYLGSAISGLLIAFYAILIQHMQSTCGRNDKWVQSIVVITSICMGFGVSWNYLFPGKVNSYITEEMIHQQEAIEEALRCFVDKDDTIYYISNNTNRLCYVMFTTSVSPTRTAKNQCWDIYESEEMKEKQMQIYANNNVEWGGVSCILTMKELEKNLEKCDYVFIHCPSETFCESYGELFESPEKIGYTTYFKVERLGTSIILKYMGNVG